MVATSIRSRPGMSLAARLTTRLTTRLPGKASPFVSQPELLDLLKKDRTDIGRQLRQAEWLAHHPHRGIGVPLKPWRLPHSGFV